MSDTATNWVVVWIDRVAGPEVRSLPSSKEQALDAACEYNQYQTALRIEGPNGEIIDREAIDEHCKSRLRRP